MCVNVRRRTMSRAPHLGRTVSRAPHLGSPIERETPACLLCGVKGVGLLKAAVDDKSVVQDEKVVAGNVRLAHLADAVKAVYGGDRESEVGLGLL